MTKKTLATILILAVSACTGETDPFGADTAPEPGTSGSTGPGADAQDDADDADDADDSSPPSDPGGSTGTAGTTAGTTAADTGDGDTGADPETGVDAETGQDSGADTDGGDDPTGAPANCMELMDQAACEAASNCTWFGEGEFGVCFDEGGDIGDEGGDLCDGLDQQFCEQLVGFCVWNGQSCVAGP